jgi:DNA polymerase
MKIKEEFDVLVNEILICKKCRLYQNRNRAVPGEGNINTKIIFIGEAPGSKEDESGRPFVGPAGKLLTILIESIGLKREDVYITNVIKCRPPGNRDPMDDEIVTCLPYLRRQLILIRPKIIVTLGRFAARVILDLAGIKFSSITREHGNINIATIEGFRTIVIPTFHPAAALYNPKIKQLLIDDFKKIGEYINKDINKVSKGPLDRFIK